MSTTLQKKICLLGDFAVGKTSLVRRFVDGRFDDRYLSTIGVKISRRTLTRAYGTLNLLVWDLAGGENYEPSSSYLAGVVGALVVCDLTRRVTLAALQRYTSQLRAANPKTVCVYLGNKADLPERQIPEKDLHTLCANFLGGPYLLTSARTGENVEAAFTLLAEHIEQA
ncbi:MAG: GTP-binding protein [Anaerolineales bacterium]|nr:GTP-binding protein [Anaerolineales bacterium]